MDGTMIKKMCYIKYDLCNSLQIYVPFLFIYFCIVAPESFSVTCSMFFPFTPNICGLMINPMLWNCFQRTYPLFLLHMGLAYFLLDEKCSRFWNNRQEAILDWGFHSGQFQNYMASSLADSYQLHGFMYRKTVITELNYSSEF